MNTLLCGTPNQDLLKRIKEIKDIKVSFTIHDSKKFPSDLDILDLIKFNFDTNIKIEATQDAQKNYEKFYNDHFDTFVYQFVRRGLKILDVHELRNYFANYYYGFFNIVKEKKIELMVFFSLPHCGPDLILYEIAKLMKIKKILMFQSIFPNKYFTIKNIEELGMRPNKTLNEKDKFTDDEIQFFQNKYAHKTKIDGEKLEEKRGKIYFKKRYFKDLIINFLIKIGFIYRETETVLDKRYLNNIKKLEKSLDEIIKIKKNKKIIFFPMHWQPELSTSILGGNYEDQLIVLERLSVFSKDNWIIVVKENILQRSYQRKDFFFRRLKNLKNVYFVDSKINSKHIIDKADVVATISGTAGFEALLKSKKCMVFGNSWYKSCHGVLVMNSSVSDEEINNFLNVKIDKSKTINDLKSLISSCDQGVVDFDFKNLVENFDNGKNCHQVAINIKNFINENFN